MWIKLFLLCLYFLLLFALSRLLEVVSWCDGSRKFYINSRVLLDPFSLSVQKLKQLLDNRGVSYSGVFEKKELIQLVEMSGMPSEEELSEDSSIDEADAAAQTTHFKCGSHFYEEVEDTKDSVWLVQVIGGDQDTPLLDDTTWRDVVRKVSRFGVRTGVFHCSFDRRLCVRKKWDSPRLILALPQGHKAKEDVVLHNYMHSSKPQVVVNWVGKHLTSRVKQLRSESHLHHWLTYSSSTRPSEIRFILFSELDEPPLFLSSLAVKFTGRVRFAVLHIDEKNRSIYKKYLERDSLPQYRVVTPENQLKYGQRSGENFTFKDLELFLKSLRPEMNDVFLWSLILVNAIAGFELFFLHSKLWKHAVRCFLCFVKYNFILFLTWLLVLTLFQFHFMVVCTELSLKMVRLMNVTNMSSILRYNWKTLCSWHFLLSVYVIFGTICGFLLKKCGLLPSEEEYSVFSDWWLFPWSNSVMSYFFRPIATMSSRASGNQDSELEEGMELLIERLAMPNLWLQPMISSEYIKDLPLWKYRGWCDADDEDCDNFKQESSNSSDDEFGFSQKCDILVSSKIDFSTNPCQSPDDCFLLPCTSQGSSGSGSQEDKTLNCGSPERTPKSRECHRVIESTEIASQGIHSTSPVNNKSESIDAARAPPGMLEFRECSICLENYRYNDCLCGLPCGHNFHANCVMLWLYRDNHCCPVCRWPSYKSKSHVIHLHSQ